ncbi:hypothetical protein Sjap_003988 [Stephania japonica]|uniref:Uncharacterized protein n=1 Tax=Stephania japonica TaxID=461633 RepID=A0AAP0PJW2_9MAGN
MDVQISMVIRAENDNEKVHAHFSEGSFILYLGGLEIAELRMGSFDVPKNSSYDLPYAIRSDSIPLDSDAMNDVDISIKRDKISFLLKGAVRTRWRVGVLRSVKFWSQLSCELVFFPSNGTSRHSNCSSSVCFFARACLHFLNSLLYFLFDAWWNTMIWTVAFFSLPYRILTAIRREHMLEMHLHEMQIEIEYLAWDKKELQERLRAATKNCKIIESMLTELEDDHDQAIDKIELLEKELQDVKDENRRLYETQSKKDLYDPKARDHPNEQDAHGEMPHGSPRATEYDVPLVKSGHSGSGVKIQDLLMHGDRWKDGNKGTPQIHRLLSTGTKGNRPVYSVPGEIFPKTVSVDEILDQCKRVALSRSLFSAILSLIVGMIIWGLKILARL